MSETTKMLHTNLSKGEVGKYAIVPGDPDRCEKIAVFLDNPRKVTQKREHTTWEGYLEGQKVTITSTGMGGPSTAICVEELVKCGADTFIRVGTCASTSDRVSRGDIVIPNGTVRMEGTGAHYLPMEFPAVPDYYLLKLLEETSGELGFPPAIGISITKDSFFTQTEPETKPVREDLIFRWNAYVRGGAIATSMEEATLFLVADSLHIRAASILVSATDFAGGVSKKNSSEVYPSDTIQRPIKIAVETIRKLILREKSA
jgi:uridine phosphorylase